LAAGLTSSAAMRRCNGSLAPYLHQTADNIQAQHSVMIALSMKNLATRLALLTSSVILSAWFIAITPPGAVRRRLSDAPEGAVSVLELRMARTARAFAPKATGRFIVWRSDGTVTPSEVRRMLAAIAAGKRPQDEVRTPAR